VVDGRQFHVGLDIASYCGSRIVAAHDGIVLAAGRHAQGFMGWVGDLSPFRHKLDASSGWGGEPITVVIDDGNGYRSAYLHLAAKAVDPGQRVHAGQLIGWQGQTGHATGCHLHYELWDPRAPATIQLKASVVSSTLLPRWYRARINPLDALPPLADADIQWNWGAR
jgi:murein DD-endopeptidase MepM/ murein hydrolase activator NlpD